MADIIRPTFAALPDDAIDEQPFSMREVGRAAGYMVGLVRETTEQGRMIRVVIGLVDGDRIEAVGLVPDEPENEEDAIALALAALRTLEIVGGDTLTPSPRQ